MAISNANAGRVDTMLLKELEHYLPVRMRFLLMLFFFYFIENHSKAGSKDLRFISAG